jgi:hypothetical protein
MSVLAEMAGELGAQLMNGWLRAGRKREGERLPGDEWLLGYSRRYRLFLILAGVLSGALWLAPVLAMGESVRTIVIWSSIFGPLFLGVILVLAAAFRARITVGRAGIELEAPWRRTGRIRWEMIRRVRYRKGLGYLLIERHDGPAVRIGAMRDGLGTLGEHFERYLPGGVNEKLGEGSEGCPFSRISIPDEETPPGPLFKASNRKS